MAPCFIFLGAKVEEQPRKLEHVLKVAHKCLHKDSDVQLDVHSDDYMQMAQDLIDNESILLQTLGFDLSVEHPHTYVVKCAQMVKAAKELAQTSYFLATNSLHLTTFCIEEKPTVIACVCIYVACKWTSYEIPETHDKKRWWEYMDSNITLEKIEDMSSHFIKILDSCPTRLKKKISTGPVIYKGGTMQPKRDCDGEHSKSDKSIDSNANKTNTKVEGTSSRTGDQKSDKHSTIHSRQLDSKLEIKKDSHEASHVKKHSKHSTHSEHDKRVLEHHKHHKRKHSDGKLQSEQHDSQNSIVKQPEDKKPEKSEGSELKTSKLPDANKSKSSQSGGLSSAAKHILSLPPLHHKHSLPDTEGTASSDSPSKKQKIDTNPPKKHRYDSELGKISNQVDEKAHTSKSNSSSSSSSHRKTKPSSDKHKMRVASEKHAEMYKQMKKMSDKSSHGHKHHSVHDKHSKEKKLEHLKSSGFHGLGAHAAKGIEEKTKSSFKLKEEGSKLAVDLLLSSKSAKHSVVAKKPSSSDKGSHKTSNSIVKKNGHPSKLEAKPTSFSKESLPPPPPPPSFAVPSILPVQPPLPTEPEVKQNPAPEPSGSYDEAVASQQNYIVPDGQIQKAVMQNQMQGQVYSLQHQVTQNQQSQKLASQDYQQQLFSSSAQPINSSSMTLATPQLYYLGQESSQGGTSDGSKAYWQSMNNQNLFPPTNIGLLPQPPVPPQGLVIHQVDGLPPPPPLNLPPFPPPPT